MLQFVLAAAFAVGLTAASDCLTSPGAKCGTNVTAIACCPDNYYCQPWDPGFFQCVAMPAKCSMQLTNVDLYGDDLKTIYGITPGECCDECSQTSGCVAYTFFNSNPGRPACYLKKGTGTQRVKSGVVSGVLDSATVPTSPASAAPATTAPAPTTAPANTTAAPAATVAPANTTTAPPATVAPANTTVAPPATVAPASPTTAPATAAPAANCTTAPYGKCGNSVSGATCCPAGHYCQPWTPNNYQCVPTPPHCSGQLTDSDYHGGDIKIIEASLPSVCCEQCTKTAGCVAYTFINNNPGAPACYLKSSVGTVVTKIGAVSGRVTA